jgi:hypothetical protein
LHRADELEAELTEAGLTHLETLGIEGPAWVVPEFEVCWADERRREILLKLARWVERESTLIGMSPHLMAVALKPE